MDDRRGRTSEYMDLDNASTAYLLGKQGVTKNRLAEFTGCGLEIGHAKVELIGLPEEVDLARLCIQITLQQRPGSGAPAVVYSDLERREDVTVLDVPEKCVGFILGAKGATLRQMEMKHLVFMFFDNDNLIQGRDGPTKRLYIIGGSRDRNAVLEEVEEAISFKVTGVGHGPRMGQGPRRRSPSPRRRSPSPRRRYDDRNDDRYDRRSPRRDERRDDRRDDRRDPYYDDRRDDRDGRRDERRYDDHRDYRRYDDHRDDRRHDDRRDERRYDDRRDDRQYDDRRHDDRRDERR